jgi:AbrB family looped-hinge helix DNA binding protein
MATTRLSSKGQIVIPKALREARGWEAGSKFVVEEVADGLLLKEIKPFAPTTLEQVIGCTGYRGPKRSLEDMEAAIIKGAREGA